MLFFCFAADVEEEEKELCVYKMERPFCVYSNKNSTAANKKKKKNTRITRRERVSSRGAHT